MPPEGPDIIQQAMARSRGISPDAVASWPSVTPLSDAELEAPITVSVPGDNDLSPGPARLAPAALELDHYHLVAEISRGGQATVYRAVDSRTGDTVAIKILRRGVFLAPSDDSRLTREKRFLATLNHPNIVRLRDCGSTAGGVTYLVMDYVEGRNLDDYFAAWHDRPGYVQEVLRVFAKVARALHAAHRAGILHRDLKPQNVLVQSNGEPMILDFGLARPTDVSQWDSLSTLTATGQLIGSLPWSSPEQVSGGKVTIDHRTDVYSLGIMLYQELAGRFPYVTTGAMQGIITRILTAKPEPFAVRPESPDAGSGVEPILAPILRRLLAKSATNRHRSALAVARDLDRAAAQSAGRPLPWRARNWALVTFLAAVMGLLAGMVALGTPLSASPPRRFVNSLGVEFVRVEPGEFLMGNPIASMGRKNEHPAHRVRLTHAFYMSTTVPIEYQYYEATMNVRMMSPWLPCFLTWRAVNDFCQTLSEREGRHYRLPTEAEWEYVCRMGSDKPQRDALPVDLSNVPDSDTADTWSYKGGPPNAWGFYSMPGKAREWCSDYYGEYTPGFAVDPTGPATGEFRVVRGYYSATNRGGATFGAPGQSGQTLWSAAFRLVLDTPTP